MDTLSPTIVTAALFVSLFFIDLFNYNYKYLPIRAVAGIFCIMIISALSQNGFYGTAWLLVASPFLFIIGSIIVRDHINFLAESKNLQPPSPPRPPPLIPYFM